MATWVSRDAKNAGFSMRGVICRQTALRNMLFNDQENANYTSSVAVHLCELGRIALSWTVPLTTFSKTLQNTIVVYHCFEGRTAGRRKIGQRLEEKWEAERGVYIKTGQENKDGKS